MIRVLVADDSPTTRAHIVRALQSDPEIKVVGEAQDGIDAVSAAKRLLPDIIVMDVQMPRLNGFEATKRIMFDAPTPVVIVSSLVATREVEMSLEALRVGAVHILPKPALGTADSEDEARRFVRAIKNMSSVKVVRRRSMAGPLGPIEDVNIKSERARAVPRVIAIGASTGGPAAIHRILSNLSADLPVPVLVVQHIAVGFVDDFARWLDAASPLQVKLAESGETLMPGKVYVAPPDKHLGTRNGTIMLASIDPIGGFRPSVTFLFESVASSFGAASLAVLLTGMGRDGVDGLRAIQAAGGSIVTQDEATSVVYGMPGAAAEQGLGGTVLPLEAMASHLQRIADTKTGK